MEKIKRFGAACDTALRSKALPFNDDDIVVVTQVKNESRYIAEWMLYHSVILGIKKYIIFDNDSSDNTRQLCEACSGFADIVVVDWPRCDPKESPQFSSFDAVLGIFKALRCRGWVGFLDCDEFVNLSAHSSMLELLLSYPSLDGLALNWRIFGSSGHVHRPQGLVIENYIRRADDSFPANRHIKSFLRIQSIVDHCDNSHFFRVKNADRYLYPDGVKFPGYFNFTHDFVGGNRPEAFRIASVHHYMVKSSEDAREKQIKGRNAYALDSSLQQLSEHHIKTHDQNGIFDDSLTKHASTVREAMMRVSKLE